MSITRIRTLLAFAALLAVPVLQAGNISNIKPILIPYGLDVRDVKAATIQALARTDIKPQSTNWEAIVDSLLSARVLRYQSQFKKSRRNARSSLSHWYIESVEPEAVILGCQIRHHYMSVRMAVGDGKITPQIVTSENLRQTEDNIHGNAINWINEISVEIRKTLGQFSALKAQLQEVAEKEAARKMEENPPPAEQQTVTA